MFAHIRRGFLAASERGDYLRPVDADVTIARGVTLTMTPGHTPGHLSVIVSSGGRRALLLGDAIVCGSAFGRVKAMYDTLDANKLVEELAPRFLGEPITGFELVDL